ncbi:hypothetical protein E2562_002161 [Oryza meyeriana var. granulata]|uniref:Glycoside hydrolase family 13 N-terminal domain-containing protein n=1 Tax=Oryza meyeriana var. granulata TaxID=110450 RepID=A0A6G1EG44_9ORYZ|nr:hypothetical protein E2562_002161 [Oryza meyeriana var. granulata]
MASLPAPPAPLGSCPRGGGGVVPRPRGALRQCGAGLATRAARSCYRFRTDDDGVVDVAVSGEEGDGGAGAGGYAVSVEVPCLPGPRGREGGLVLRTSGSGEGVPLAPAAGGASLAAELSFDAPCVPFYLSFLLTDAAGAEIRTHRKTSFRVPVGVGPGSPAPLGMSRSGDGAVNFAVYSKNANAVALYLYASGDEPALEIDLDPYVHRTGNVWHVSLASVEGYVSYAFCCGGIRRPLLDPYAKVIGDFVAGNSVYDVGVTAPSMRCFASLASVPSYNWGRDRHPCLPLEKLVVYRANVALFTKDKSSGLPEDAAGTFSGLAAKIEHFRSLGVSAILLEPVFPFHQVKGPYFPYHFFSPMSLYSSEGSSVSAIKSMKDMVKAMHRNGIEYHTRIEGL